VLLVELPLFPFQNAFGVVQRNTVSSHGAAMLPKRCFAKVLGMRGGTVDGLHLSQEGHNAMAEIMAEVLQGE
jgi:lysophospholipase L1-like esterase